MKNIKIITISLILIFCSIYSQIKLQYINSQIGLSYYHLIKYYGQPLETFYEKGYRIIVYKVEYDLGAISDMYSEYFGDSFSFLILNKNVVIGNVIKLYMHDFEMLKAFYDGGKKKRIQEYQSQPIHETPMWVAWEVYSPELNETLTEILIMGYDPTFTIDKYWGIIGAAKKDDFDKLTVILESYSFINK